MPTIPDLPAAGAVRNDDLVMIDTGTATLHAARSLVLTAAASEAITLGGNHSSVELPADGSVQIVNDGGFQLGIGASGSGNMSFPAGQILQITLGAGAGLYVSDVTGLIFAITSSYIYLNRPLRGRDVQPATSLGTLVGVIQVNDEIAGRFVYLPCYDGYT